MSKQESFWDKYSWLGYVIGFSVIVIPMIFIQVYYIGPESKSQSDALKQMDCKTLKDHLVKGDLNKWFVDQQQIIAQIIGRCP